MKFVANLSRPKTKVFNCWAGMYGGHFDIIVLFKTRPTQFEEWDGGTREVQVGVEKDEGNWLCTLSISAFADWWPDAWVEITKSPFVHRLDSGQPRHTDIHEEDLFELEIEMPVDETGEPIGLNYCED